MSWITNCSYTPQPLTITVPAHFPPLPVPPDNPMTVEKWELGQRLFFDPILSGNGKLSCASCHQPSHGLASPFPTDVPLHTGLPLRNTPSLWNVGYAPSLMAEGGVPNLEAQALAPLSHAGEMNTQFNILIDTLQKQPHYRILFHKAFGQAPSVENIVKALACYQRSFVSGTAAWDLFVQGDSTAISVQAQKGAQLFFSSKLGCATCHTGVFFTNHQFFALGVPSLTQDIGLARKTGLKRDYGKFKTPSLRNVAITAPYMHNGIYATLDEVIEFYNKGTLAQQSPPNHTFQPLHLSLSEKQALVAFLHTLTDNRLK